MQYTFLGNSELRVSVMGLGCSGMSMGATDSESIATIHHAIERGVIFFDTSDAYGNGHNERLLASEYDIIPIPGTTHIDYLEKNIGSTDIILKPEEINHLNAMFKIDAAAGTRYPKKQMPFMGF